MSAYQELKAALERIKPDGWEFTPWEPIEDRKDVTSLTMKVRAVRPLPAAPNGKYEVDWVLTITSSLTSRESADPALYDELIEFLAALDDPDEGLDWLGWTEANKVAASEYDERLAYDITIRTNAERNQQPDSPA